MATPTKKFPYYCSDPNCDARWSAPYVERFRTSAMADRVKDLEISHNSLRHSLDYQKPKVLSMYG